ncbi:MAG TPA: hypothetical protein VF771_00150, partial [Longimicrobiaceae bacterium]
MNQTRRNLLQILIGGASLVVLTAGLRAASGLLNPVLMAGFLALLLQPLVPRLRRLGVAGGVAVGLVVFALVIAGLTLAGFVGISLRQVALEIPTYRTRLEAISSSITRML